MLWLRIKTLNASFKFRDNQTQNGTESTNQGTLMLKAKPKIKRRHKGPFAAGLAVLFNLSMIAGPVLAVRAAYTAFGGEVYGYSPTEATLDLTKREMDKAFGALIPSGADKRTYWSSLVSESLDENDVSAARGFLLAADAMLGSEDKATLNAAINDRARQALGPNAQLRAAQAAANDGTEAGNPIREQKLNEARIAAALTLLPDAVRVRYERMTSTLGVAMRNASEFATGAITGESETLVGVGGAVTADFFVLGDVRDLSIQSMRWLNNEPVDMFLVSISGIGLALTAATVSSGGSTASAKAGASLLKAAKRSSRINPKLMLHFERQFEAALPKAVLRRNLDAVLSGQSGLTKQTDDVLGAFKSALKSDAAKVLADDLVQVQAIAAKTSPSFALKMLGTAEDATDLRRARQLVDAGGDRAAALVKRMGVKALRVAKTAVKWTQELYQQVAAMLAALAMLGLSAVISLVRSFRPREER
jgi:hypothetical protein